MKKTTTIALLAAAALSVNVQTACAAEPFIPVFITDGARKVTPALFPELSVFRESIPSYPVNSNIKIKRFTPLSQAYKYPQEYVRRLSDKERRLTPYRFEEMFADPASTIDSEYARSGKPFFIYERISRPPYFLPRDGAPLDEPTSSSYTNKQMIEPQVQADIFDTLVPIRGDSGTDIPKRKIGEQGCLFNSEFGGFFDVLCPDSGQDSAAFAQALSRYRHVLVAGNAFNKDKFDSAALAAFEKSGGRVHRYPSEECPTKDKLRELLLKIPDETMPVTVAGDIQWGVNKTSKGWLVWMINNKGVVKFSDEPEEFRKERTAHVVATVKATGEKFEADIAPGDFKLWETK